MEDHGKLQLRSYDNVNCDGFESHRPRSRGLVKLRLDMRQWAGVTLELYEGRISCRSSGPYSLLSSTYCKQWLIIDTAGSGKRPKPTHDADEQPTELLNRRLTFGKR